MRKWLVGLLAAGLCATSALAVTDTLTADDFAATSTTYTEFSNVTKDSPAVYAGKSSKSKDGAIQLRTTGSDCGIVTTASGGTATKVTVTWAEGNAEGRTVDVYGKTEAYSSAADLFASATQGQSLGSIALGTTELAIEGDYSYIGLRSKSGALYLSSVEIEWGGEPAPVEFSIALKPDEDFEVVQGKSASITATVKGAQGDVTYSWSVDGTPIDLAGNVYEIDSAEVGGPYEVTCEADDGVSEPVSASVSYTVVEAPVVTGDVLTRETTEVTGSSYTDWTATGDSGTKYVGNSAGGNDSIQLRSDKNTAGIVITESAGSDVASVTVEWNENTSEGRTIQIYGSTEAYGSPADLYGDAKGTLLGEIAKGDTTLDVPEGYPYVGIRSKSGALYLSSVAFEFAGEAGLSVTLDKANGFTVDLGTADSITATAKNGTEPYEYVWSSDTAELNGTGEVLDIPATLAAGDYTVQVEVTDAEANKASKQIAFSVVAPAVKYPITIADGIENGEITVDKTEAEEGETVTVTATPVDGFALEAITVNGIAISATTFPMPAEAVEVGATFAEVKDYAELPFIAEDTPYTGPWQKATIDGLTSKGLGTDYTSGGVSVGAKFDTTGDWMQIKFDGTPDELVYAIKGNSVSETNNSIFLVQESATGAEDAWSTLATYQTEDGTLTTSQETKTNALAADSRFVRFIYDTKGAGNVGIYGVYISSGGPAVFSITLDPAEDFEVEQNAEAFVTAIPKHAAEGVVGYAWWIDGTPVDTDGEVLALATAELGPHKVVCDATDASGAEADAHVIYTVVAPAVKYAVNVALGIQNGSVATDVSEAAEGDTVTVTATAADGYRLVEIIVNNGDVAVSGNTFVMPAQDVLVTATFEEKPPVTGDVLTNDDVGSQTSSYKDWTAEKESGAVYAGLTAGGSATNPCIQLRSTSNSGIVMAKDSGQNVSSVTIEWNAQSAADRVVQVYGSTTPYSSPADLYGDAKGTLLGELTNGSGEVTVDVAAVGEFPYIGIRSKSGALYLTSVAIDFGGAAAFSIALDPAEDFEVVQGKDAAITATVRGAQGEVSYSWSVNGTPIDLAGNVYAIDSTEVGGPFEVVCAASDGVSDPVSASVSYTVVEVPPVTGDEFTLISSVDGLKDGTRVVLTDPDGTLALSATVESSVFTPTGVAPVGDVITTDNANIIWKLVDDGEGHFSLYNEEAGKYAGHAGGGTSNSGRLQDDPFPNAFSVEDGLFVVVATTADSAENYRNLQFNQNGTNPRFAYYKGTQKNLRIYAAESGPGPQPGEPAIVFGGDGEGTVGTPVNFTVTAVNVSDPQVYFDTIVTAPDDSDVTVDDIICNFPDVSFIPDCAGEYTFKFVAGVPETSDYAEGTWTVTVTGEGPGPQPGEAGITKMTIAAGKMTIEFFGEGAQVLVSDDLETWTPVNGAVSPYTIEMGSDPQYIGVR